MILPYKETETDISKHTGFMIEAKKLVNLILDYKSRGQQAVQSSIEKVEVEFIYEILYFAGSEHEGKTYFAFILSPAFTSEVEACIPLIFSNLKKIIIPLLKASFLIGELTCSKLRQKLIQIDPALKNEIEKFETIPFTASNH